MRVAGVSDDGRAISASCTSILHRRFRKTNHRREPSPARSRYGNLNRSPIAVGSALGFAAAGTGRFASPPAISSPSPSPSSASPRRPRAAICIGDSGSRPARRGCRAGWSRRQRHRVHRVRVRLHVLRGRRRHELRLQLRRDRELHVVQRDGRALGVRRVRARLLEHLGGVACVSSSVKKTKGTISTGHGGGQTEPVRGERCWFGLAVRGREAVAARPRARVSLDRSGGAVERRGARHAPIRATHPRSRPIPKKAGRENRSRRRGRTVDELHELVHHPRLPLLHAHTSQHVDHHRGIARDAPLHGAVGRHDGARAEIRGRRSPIVVTSESEANIFERYKRSVRLNEKHTVRASPDHGGRCPNARAEAEARR